MIWKHEIKEEHKLEISNCAILSINGTRKNKKNKSKINMNSAFKESVRQVGIISAES
jgi:hypothetical protein